MDGGQQALSLVISFTLAAMLGPRVYGVVAMATLYIMFVELVQRQGMSAAVIQRKRLDPEHQDTAFWLVLGLSLMMAAASVGGAGWWAAANDLPELRPVLVALSLLVPIQGLIIVPDALLRRRMEFRRLALRTLVAVAAGGLAGIGGALAGWGVWALVAQQLATGLASVVVLWSVSGWRPRARFSRRAARDLTGFSTGSFLSSVAVFVNNRADAVLVGLFFGPVVVGIYRLAGRLVEMLLSATVRPVQSLSLPELSPHQDDRPEFARRLARLMRLSATVALPALGLLAGVAEPLVAVLGPEWSAAAPALRILCVVGAVRVVVALNGPMLQAVGSPFVQAAVSWLAAAASAATFAGTGLALADRSPAAQVVGIATAAALFYGVVIGGLHVFLVRRYTDLSLRAAVAAHAGPLGAGLAAAGGGALASFAVSDARPVAAAVAAGGAAVLAGAVASWALVPEARRGLRLVGDGKGWWGW
jgi:O-antigen/teichoic acid export membrane protein